jgi:hypothetical protein
MVLILSIIAVSALVLRFFFVFTPAPVPEEVRPMPTVELTAPASFGSIVHVPAVDAPPAPVPEEPLRLSGIMNLDNKSRAIIDGCVLEVGDTIRGATVTDIGKDYVLLSSKDEKIKLKLK